MNNDIVAKARLNAALGAEGNMGFGHNDIVTMDVMEKAIAEGGGGSIATAKVTFVNSASDSSAAYVVLLSFPISENIGAITVGHTPVSVDVPLYNGAYVLFGTAFGTANFSTGPTVTGSITWDDDKFVFIVRGDGTITLAPER